LSPDLGYIVKGIIRPAQRLLYYDRKVLTQMLDGAWPGSVGC
jgi:hypothetical protein